MKYIVCDTDKARGAGISTAGKLGTKDQKKVMLNESSVMNCRMLEGTFEERTEALDGEVLTDAEAQSYVRKEKMKIM